MVGGRSGAAILVAALVAWGALPVAPASAQRAKDEAEREYRLGYKALQAGDCAEALVHYSRSLELTPRPRTLFNIAACEEELGLEADAWRSYHAFLDLAEARDAEIVVKARARIDALRAVLRGKVTVESSPPGASVFVDGERQRGVTPLTLAIEPGPHTIRVTLPDAIPAESEVEVYPDEVAKLSVTLALPSEITVVADPLDASIELEGGAAATVGRYEAAVAPGRHVFTVRRDGYLPVRLEVDAVAGRSHVERVRLQPVPSLATLVIAGMPDAVVTIDGAAATSTTTTSGALELRELAAGAHEIVVTAAGRSSWRDTLHLSPGEVVTVDLEAPREAAPGRRALGWGLGGLGVAGIAGGGVVGVLALRDVGSPLPDEHDRGKRRALLADGLFVVGTVAVVAAWRLLRGRSPSAAITRTHEGTR